MNTSVEAIGGIMRFYKTILMLFLSGMALVGSAAGALASTSPAQVVIVSTNVSFDSSSPATATFTVSLINLTEQSTVIGATPSNPSGKACKITPDPNVVPAATQQTVAVTLRGCALPTSGGFLVTLTADGQALPTLTVAPATPAVSTPDWTLFVAFPIAVVAAAVILAAAGCRGYWRYYRAEKDEGKPETNRLSICAWWWKCALNLSTGWSLKDSWASNVTVIGAAFAGVFGSSDVLKAVLGNATDPVFALALVSGAVAAGIVGAAPLILAAVRWTGGVTPAALLAGASLTVGAAGGELAVITLGAQHLPLGGVEDAMLPALILGSLILACYTYLTMLGSLPPKPQSPGKKPIKQPENVSSENFRQIEAMAAELPKVYLPHAIAEAYGENVPYALEGDRRTAVF